MVYVLLVDILNMKTTGVDWGDIIEENIVERTIFT